jgi:hypothetical protein
MNKRLNVFLAIVVLLALAASAQAQPDWTQRGQSMGIAFSENPTDWSDRCATTPAFVPFNAYLLAPETDNINGFEATVSFPAGWTVLTYLTNPEDILNVCTAPCFIAGLGQSFSGDPHYTLVTMNMGWFSPTVGTDQLMCVGPADPSSSGDRPNVVLSNVITPTLDMWCDETGLTSDCAIINPTTISCPVSDPACLVETGTPVESSSFGAIKAKY